MKKIYNPILIMSLMLVISCGFLGGSSTVSVESREVKKSFEPKTSLAFINKESKRPGLNIYLANYDFKPKNRGDLFHPNLHENPDQMIVRLEVLNAASAAAKDVFQPGEYNLENDDAKQRFYLLNVIGSKNGTTDYLKFKNYKEAEIKIISITEEEVTGTFDIRFIGLNADKKEDETAFAKGSFKAKFWKENP